MPNDLLPIKFFAKRKDDERRVEGGGSGKLPSWVLKGEELIKKSNYLSNSVVALENTLNERDNRDSIVPLVAKVKLFNKATAKTHRSKVKELLQVTNNNKIIGMVSDDEVLLTIKTAKEATAINKKMQDTDKFAQAISAIDSIDQFEPYMAFNPKIKMYKVKLLDFQSYELNRILHKRFEKMLTEKEIEFIKTDYTENMIIYNLKNLNLDSFETIKESDSYDSFLSFEPMPIYSVSLDNIGSETNVKIKKNDSLKECVTVGVLDSGIAPIPHLKPWLSQNKFSPYPEQYVDRSHGTFVSGIIVYGDELGSKNWTGQPSVKIFDANVFPDLKKETISEDELVQNIREVIEKNKDEIKIWNLSGGWNIQIDEDSFSDLAYALDDIQDSNNVLICKSAGNCSNFINDIPKSKINQGADSIRSLVVGSIAHKKEEFDISEIDNPSPFTKIGRGPSSIIKPEVVHYGGNAGVDKSGKLVKTGVTSFDVNGNLTTAIGTSFSTPRITALSAGLLNEINEEFDPLLIKGLIIHSASYPQNLKLPEAERTDQIGFGIPKTYKEILYNTPNEVTLILRDTLEKSEFVEILDFPMPDCMKKDGYYQGQIFVTLVNNCILEPSQGAEYCQSNIDVSIGTYSDKKLRDTNKPTILNPVGKNEPQNLLSATFSKTKMKAARGTFAKQERMQVKYQGKFYPIKKYAIDLADLTDGNREKYITEDRRWYLKLESLFRDFTEDKADRESSAISHEFCLIVTLRDPSGSGLVYQGVSQKLDEFNFWHNNIDVKSHVKIQGRN